MTILGGFRTPLMGRFPQSVELSGKTLGRVSLVESGHLGPQPPQLQHLFCDYMLCNTRFLLQPLTPNKENSKANGYDIFANEKFITEISQCNILLNATKLSKSVAGFILSLFSLNTVHHMDRFRGSPALLDGC